jgi:hypothetical protein
MLEEGEKNMKQTYLLATACAFLFAGCQHLPPDSTTPRVFIAPGGKIVLDQSPIRVDPRSAIGGMVSVTWTLPADKDYTFPNDGVQIKAVPIKEKSPDDKPVTCGNEIPRPSDIRHELRVTAVELAPSLRTIPPKDFQCGVVDSTRKQYRCSFPPGDGRTVYKYSIYVCQGGKLLDSYDPFMMN